MSAAENDAIDLADDEASASQGASACDQPKQRSNMYTTWDVQRTTEYRDRTHHGAWCNPCLAQGVEKMPKGQFFASIEGVLGHVKDCHLRSSAVRNTAGAELKLLRDKKNAKKGTVAGLKRSASSMTGATSSSNKKSMSDFCHLADVALSPTEQAEWELQLLRATVSANIPLSSWDDVEFQKCFSLVRPELVIPSRKVLSTRILDAAAKIADKAIEKTLEKSDGELLCTSLCCTSLVWSCPLFASAC